MGMAAAIETARGCAIPRIRRTQCAPCITDKTVYDAYQQDLRRVNERLGKVIAEYAKAYNKSSVDNETAKRLLKEALAIEEAEVRLKRSYLPRLEKVIPATKVARYLQIETKIRALMHYELAAQIPLVY